MKFGGTSLDDAEKMKHVAGLISRYLDEGYELVVVASALSGVTDALLKMSKEASRADADVTGWVDKLFKKHIDLAENAVSDSNALNTVVKTLEELRDELEKLHRKTRRGRRTNSREKTRLD